MINAMPAGPAQEQLQELIAILRELGNAGPRDQSFKQWRQVTLTLLQRIWPGEPARAAIFRRILFSAPTARSDAAATREYFERGCSEASAYLEGLALELETGVALKTLPSAAAREEGEPAPRDERGEAVPAREVKFRPTRPAESTRPAEPDRTEQLSPRAVPPPPIEFTQPSASTSPAAPARSPEPTPSVTASPAAPKAGNAAGRSKARLKDMLGFGDDTSAARETFTRPSAPVSSPPSPSTVREITPISRPPLTVAPRPMSEPVLGTDQADQDQELAAESAMAAAEAKLGDTAAAERGPETPRPSPTLAAREVLSMAGLVAELGVPAQRRAIVRAALIDLGRQMDSPPVHWAAIRQALAFMLDYPQIARRVLPLLLPYLEEAA